MAAQLPGRCCDVGHSHCCERRQDFEAQIVVAFVGCKNAVEYRRGRWHALPRALNLVQFPNQARARRALVGFCAANPVLRIVRGVRRHSPAMWLLLCVSPSFAPPSPTTSVIVDIGCGIRVTASEATPPPSHPPPPQPRPPWPRQPRSPAFRFRTTRFPRTVVHAASPTCAAQSRPRSSASSPRAHKATRIARPSWWSRAT